MTAAVPKPPTTRRNGPVTLTEGHVDGVATLPEHTQFCVVGRYRDNTDYRLLGWLRETDDPERVLASFAERHLADVHFERRTSTHLRATLEEVVADRDTTVSIREQFRARPDREQRRNQR